MVATYDEVIRISILEDLEPHIAYVYLAFGKRLWFLKSFGYNFKITVKKDLDKFEGLLMLKKKQEAYR